VGKTEFALFLAEALGTELVYADSMAVYRGMDVGTAKPTNAQRKRVPHHLIDVAGPNEPFNAQRFLELASPVLGQLVQGGKVPIVVGGTGLYLRALTRGLLDAASGNPQIMEEIEALADDRGSAYLHRELQRMDPRAAERIQPEDRRRLVRALAVFRAHGRPISELQKETTVGLPYRFFRLGLCRNREDLYLRINKRVDGMMQDGLLDETRILMRQGLSRSARQALGYREMIDYLEGRTDFTEAVGRTKTRTRRFAKRQLTWFRAEPGVCWVDLTGRDSPEEIMELVSGFLVKLFTPWKQGLQRGETT